MKKYAINEWNVGVGLMSGTSLDGLDIAVCSFRYQDEKWEYVIEDAVTFPYDQQMRALLMSLTTLNGPELMAADRKLGKYYGELVSGYVMGMGIQPLYIASHGHTVFHNPGKGFTFQAGHGAAIAAETGVPVVCDFRSSDVALGGQGAPLVPIGDELLFGHYDAFVNLGGFANISLKDDGQRIAYDICPVNIVFNHFSRMVGLEYDQNGSMAAAGNPDQSLLETLDNLAFYSARHPKTLGREWVENEFLPAIERSGIEKTEDILCTLTHHVVHQVVCATEKSQAVLFTGGGAKNTFLTSHIRDALGERLVIPDETTVDFKEALIFAFMGWLRLNEMDNTLMTATGARKPVSAGAVYLP